MWILLNQPFPRSSLSTDRGNGDSFAKMGDKIKLEFKSSESIKIPKIYITNEIVEVSGSDQDWFALYNVKSGDDYKLNSPTELSGISLWLDASNIDGENNRTISIDDPISQWKDLSGGNTNFAYQEDSLKQPKLKSSSLVYPVVNFDGNDDYLIGSYENSFSNKNISVFLVKRQDDNNRQNTFISTNEDYGYTRYDITHWDNTENTIVYFRDQSDVSKHTDIYTNTSNNEFDIFYNEIDSMISNSYLNGRFNSTINEVENNSTLENYLIGKRPNNSVTLQGDIAELIIYNRKLSEIERRKLNYYLAKKWSLLNTSNSDDDSDLDQEDPTPVGNLSEPRQTDFIVLFEDLAGNQGIIVDNTTDSTFIGIDTTRPELLDVSIVSNNPDNTTAKSGDNVTLSFKTTEPIQTPTDSEISITGLDTLSFNQTDTEGMSGKLVEPYWPVRTATPLSASRYWTLQAIRVPRLRQPKITPRLFLILRNQP